MDQKEELETLIKEADQSREKSLILLICANKSLIDLKDEFERQEFSDEQIDQLNQLLDCVDNIINLWFSKLDDKTIKLDELIELIEESELINTFVNLFYRNLTSKFIQIEHILSKLYTNLPLAKEDNVPFYLFLMEFTQRFKQENSEEKFRLSEKLNGYLNKNLIYCLDNDKVKNCIRILSESIYDILQNKLTDKLRSPIFQLVSTITFNLKNLNWFIQKNDERRSFLLISRLACIESRMCLETKLDDLNLLINSLIIIEYSIKILVDTEEDDTKSNDNKNNNILDYLTNDDIVQLIDAIKLLMQSIVIYLNDNESMLINEMNVDLNEDIVLKQNQFIICLRILCLYLTFENEFLKDEFNKIINLIIKFILNELTKIDLNINIINLCLNALLSIINNDPNKYKQLIKLNLINQLDTKLSNRKNDEIQVFKNFIDSINWEVE